MPPCSYHVIVIALPGHLPGTLRVNAAMQLSRNSYSLPTLHVIWVLCLLVIYKYKESAEVSHYTIYSSPRRHYHCIKVIMRPMSGIRLMLDKVHPQTRKQSYMLKTFTKPHWNNSLGLLINTADPRSVGCKDLELRLPLPGDCIVTITLI